jgi:hypothetical protein
VRSEQRWRATAKTKSKESRSLDWRLAGAGWVAVSSCFTVSACFAAEMSSGSKLPGSQPVWAVSRQ